MSRRPGRSFVYLLIALLLLAQQGFALHGLSHGVDALKIAKQSQNDPRGLQPDRLCDLCPTYAQLAAAAPVTPAALAAAPLTHATPVALRAQARTFVEPGYRSRAPPRFA